MKKSIIFSIFILVFLISISSLHAIVIDELTYITTNTVYNEDVYITSNGALYNQGGTYSVTINGSITNQGIIGNNPGGDYLNVEVTGNVTNSGTWNCHLNNFTGSSDQEFTAGSGAIFEGDYYYFVNSILAKSDLHFSGAVINLMDWSVFDFSEGWDLFIDGGKLHSGEITGSTNSRDNTILTMSNNAYLEDFLVNDVTLDGVVSVNSGCIFSGEIINEGVLQNRPTSSYAADLECNIINNGTIQNSSNYLTLNCYGNIDNYGVWDNYKIEFWGTSDQFLYLDSNATFEIELVNNYTESGVIAETDLRFVNSKINFNEVGELDISGGYRLELDGGYLMNCNLVGSSNPGETFLKMSNNAYLDDFTGNNLTLEGTVQVKSNCVFTESLTNDGTLRNFGNSSYTCEVNCDITNTVIGSISDYNSYYLTINIEGDITNFGTWDNNRVNLTGNLDHYIYCSTSANFECSYFYGPATRGFIYLDTDVEFVNTLIDLQNNDFTLATGNTLTVDGQLLRNGSITGNNGILNFTNNAYIANMTINDIILQGTCQIGDNNVLFIGNLVVNGVLQNYSSTTYNCSINDGIINNGTIRDNPINYYLNLSITGDIENNGIWSNEYIGLFGIKEPHISCGTGCIFTVDYFYCSDSTSTVYFYSDIGFLNSVIDLASNNLILLNGGQLSLDGSLLYTGTIIGNNAVLYMQNNANIQDIDIYNIELQGVCQIADSNVDFFGATLITGTLQNYPSTTYTVRFHNDVINNGVIQNGATNNLEIYIAGDIYQNGIWNNGRIYLNGSGNQHITCAAATNFDLNYFDVYNAGRSIYLDSDVQFLSTSIDLNDCSFIMQSGNHFTVDANYLKDGIITGNDGTLVLLNYAYIQDLALYDLTIQGDCYIADSNCSFNGQVTLNGTLQNWSSSMYDLEINDNFINYGIIRDNLYNYNLTIYCYGNVENYGTWINYRMYFDGDIDQFIINDAGAAIDSDVRFTSDVAGSPYQWYLGGVPLNSDDFSGETNQELDWNVPLPNGYIGTFNCIANGVNSRNLFVQYADILPPANVLITVNNDDILLTWSSSVGATSYNVYRSTSPNSGFVFIGSTANTMFTDGDGALQEKYFYRITAVIGSE